MADEGHADQPPAARSLPRSTDLMGVRCLPESAIEGDRGCLKMRVIRRLGGRHHFPRGRSSPMKKRVYSATDIMHVDWQRILMSRAGQEAVVGVDVGKLEMRAVLRWADGTFERPWGVANPGQVGALVDRVGELARGGGGGGGGGRRVRVAMESTGTYGDALRQALADAGVEAHLVSGKRAHDYAEVFDGVPSQHDGKDAAVVAELCALGKSLAWPWPAPDEQVGQLMFLVDQLE